MESHDGDFGFLQANPQLYRAVVKPAEGKEPACFAPALSCSWQTGFDRLIDDPCLIRMEPISFRTPLALLLLSLSSIAAAWWWLATPISLERAPIDPNAKLMCVSYAPFRGEQTPLSFSTYIPAEQISADLAE